MKKNDHYLSTAPGRAQESGGVNIGDWRGPLWDAINKYTKACRGDPSSYVYGNMPRMNAVSEVERVVVAALTASQRKEPT